MAQDKQLTPEKQLLNLIEKPAVRGSLHAAAIKYHGLSLFSFAALKGRLAFLKNRISKAGAPQLDIRVINGFLKLSVVILSLYFMINLFFFLFHLKQGLKINPEKPGREGFAQVVSPLKAASYYLEQVRERDIFRMGQRKASVQGSKGPSQALLEATQYLRLVGISWSADPDVMIEDTKNQRTLFLKKGRTIDNDVKVEAIFKDKVVLSFRGEEVELR